ncbi:Inner membrane ABC transporter permease protein YdcV [Roseivivax sp. THAF40]|uniref:ABC transporter permease n=1 Tax=unclassified Roseivivax TaxID=2639302 RepID=UPI0012694CB5|nr:MULTISPECIES: ABC transporter permease [unclassified Roseivivax]QFS84494.1 Inner membrane ABC transporter permease protein YdcV [Roseivivax sp. THAF197b]QFT48322.1 Inner membrane ABC transporter permease protein YdcV [Roseivivax sp. THAF40]
MSEVVLTEAKTQPLGFSAGVVGAAGAFFGLFVGTSQGSGLMGIVLGGVICAALTVAAMKFLGTEMEKTFKYGLIAIFLVAGFVFGGLPGAIVLGLFGWFLGWFIYWIGRRRYREKLVPYLTGGQVLWHYAFRVLCGAILVFLITPILVVMPLSFNAEDFFTFTPEMLRLDPEGYSLKHYRDFLTNPEWTSAVWNSVRVAPVATLISVTLGTLAAIGLSQSHVPGRQAIMAILISPMIVPLIISATGMYFFYSKIGIVGTYWGVVLAHAVLGIPFVIITVTATLVGFDKSLVRASANLGANPVRTFFKVQMPLILPGVISGGLFAFITSFDEVVVVIFIGSAELQTLPWQMFTGLREQISPTILAAATILVCISIALLATVEVLRRRSERLRGLSPS